MAKYNISVDVGGTFTDAFITFGERRQKVKVETTPHDLTVCLVECIEEGSRKLGVEIGDMLRQAEGLHQVGDDCRHDC